MQPMHEPVGGWNTTSAKDYYITELRSYLKRLRAEEISAWLHRVEARLGTTGEQELDMITVRELAHRMRNLRAINRLSKTIKVKPRRVEAEAAVQLPEAIMPMPDAPAAI